MAVDNKQIELIAESIVREYLSRKGLQSTLQMMDEECPRNKNSISNRQVLMKTLKLDKLMMKNKEQENSLRAMLEVMTKFCMESPFPLQPEVGKNSHVPELMKGDNTSILGQANVDSDKYLTSLARPTTVGMNFRKNRSDNDLVIEDNVESETIVGDGKSCLLNKQFNGDLPNFSRSKMTRPLSSKAKTGGINSTLENNGGRQQFKKSKGAGSTNEESLNQQSYHSQTDTNAQKHLARNNEEGLQNQSSGAGSFWDQLGIPQNDVTLSLKEKQSMPSRTKSSSFQELLSASEEKAQLLSQRLSGMSTLPETQDSKYGVNSSSFGKEKLSSKALATNRIGSGAKSNASKIADVLIDDVDDLDSEVNDVLLQPATLTAHKPQLKLLESKPIELKTALDLKKVVLGSAAQIYTDEWRLQSFGFCDLPQLQYGIIQRKGGPCGVLAAVQAVFMQEMLFGENKLPSSRCMRPSRSERTTFLVMSIARICWRAGENVRAVIAVPSTQCYVMASSHFKHDQITEKLMLYTFSNYSELLEFLKQSVQQFEFDGNGGVVLCMYSAILSRGIEKIKNDMDETSGKMIAAHGYCTQELVNLLLTGRAVSNVFNDVMELDSGTGTPMILKGISGRSDIGLLSLFEHYKSCQVGTYYKTPRYPIWVVCSESHFSVLFSTRLELLSDWKAERRFELFYYDGLAKQQEEIKLTVTTTNKFFQPPSDEDLVPPLEHCIRTKWHGAEIDWNGYEPIL